MGRTRRWWNGRVPSGGRWRSAIVAVLVLVAGLAMPVGVGGPGGRASAAPDQADPADRAAAQEAGPENVLPPGGRWTVTLLTGEVVDVWSDADGRAGAAVREHLGSMRTLRKPNGDLYVTPVRVTPLLTDVLDVELFNVTGLVRQRYDDASTDAVPLIVQHRPGTDTASALTTLATAEATQPLPSIDAVATEVLKGDARATGELLAELSGDVDARAESVGGIGRIWLDRRVTTQSTVSTVPTRIAPSAPRPQAPPPLDGNLTRIGADEAWAAGFTGAGVRVAVLDTGIDARHPDLAGRIVAQENFSASPDVVDRFGHGTHVAATIAGTGAAAEGARRGVAPDADLLVGKVLDDDGFGSESGVIAGMEWAAPQADVVNMSLGDDFPSDGSDPLSLAVDALTEQHGTLFVVAAGNAGPASGTVGSPGASDRALTVGAVDAADATADFSSRGPLFDSNELKPEVVAPGVDIVAARATGTAMGEPVDADYTTASGTSMATPHVAGAAAVLAQQHPDWNGDRLKSALVGSTDPTGADGFDAGAGRIDVGDAVEIAALADRDVVDVALPEPRTEPHTEPITWTNTTGQQQTLALDAELEDRQGDPIDGVSVEPAEITLPADGSGTATLHIDAPEVDPGLYSGVVTADPTPSDTDDDSGGDVRTPVGLHASPETATLTIEATPPPAAGDDTPFGSITIVNLDDFATYNLVGGFYFGASPSVEVPVGRYAVVGDVSTVDFDSQVVAQVGDPEVTIDGDTTVAFDGSDAVPFTPTVEGVDDATPVATNVGSVITPSAGTGGFGVESEVFSWYPSPPVHVTEMEGDPAHFAVRRPVVRLQAPPITARTPGSDEPVEVITVDGDVRSPAGGEHTWRAIDAGNGQDLSAARDQLAVVRLPADRSERERVTQRAEEAGVAVLAFVDPTRPVLTLSTFNVPFTPWGDVPVVAAAGTSAGALEDAAAAGDDVTITVTPSPYVYDLVLSESDGQVPDPVVDRSEQRRLARVDERFHRDPDGTGAELDRRRAVSVSLMELDTRGPLPERRTAHLTPEVTWQSYVIGDGLFEYPWGPELTSVALSITPETSYAGGSRQRLDWLHRPMPPGPAGVPQGRNFCQPRPVERTVETMYVAVAPFQDGRDHFTCNAPATSTLTLERDGTVVGTVPIRSAAFPVPTDRGSYRLVYEQSGASPYPHRSTTTWSFRSAGDPGTGLTRIPLLVVDYDLPLDTRNRPTSRTATFTIRQVTGADQRRIESLRVWTSSDDGATWQLAPVRRHQGGAFRVTLPRVAGGTGVSLRVDARDVAGNRVEQSLLDAYTA